MSLRTDHRSPAETPRHGERGLSFIELLIVLVIISVVASVALVTYGGKHQKALMARCHAELRSIQKTIYTYYLINDAYPPEDRFWEVSWNGRKPGPYHFLLEPPDEPDRTFVVLCQHDHGELARYVYVVDEGPPTLAVSADDPGYDRLVDGEGG